MLFLIPKGKIESLRNLLNLLIKLNGRLRRFLFAKITRIFRRYYFKYLKLFILKYSRKRPRRNIFIFKFKESNFYLELNKKMKNGLLYIKFENSPKKRRVTDLNFISFKQSFIDERFYQAFFLPNTPLK
jgi:hypothetical protein